MQTICVNNRLPQVYRVVQRPVATQTRNMSLFPRVVANDFAPLFRLMDGYAQHVASRNGGAFTQSLRSFQPRFDVKESKDSYELQGELPGLDQKDINIEFTDTNTLSIKGRTERVRQQGDAPAAQVQDQVEAEQPKAVESTESETSSYHKASVEDESGANPEATPTETPVATPAESTAAATETQEVVEAPKTPSSRYWVSERSVGQFARTFSFPTRIDQESVKAGLKDGILNIVVPKAVVPENKRINIE